VNNLSKPGRYADGNGLWLQVGPTGGKSWLFIYRKGPRGASKQTWLGLGPAHTISLKQARIEAKKHREALLKGEDPLQTKLAAQAVERISFEEAAGRCIASKRKGWKSEKHAGQWVSTLETYVYPLIGSVPVAAVDVDHVLRVLEQPVEGVNALTLWEAKRETAARVRGRIETVLDWAKARKLRSGENPALWRGHLENLLAARPTDDQPVHHAALAVSEMGKFMAELRRRAGASARALEFTILCAARTGEVIGADWAEVDLEAGLWTVPAARMKAGVAHRVPLPPRALEILRNMPSRTGFLFPGSRPGKGLSNMAMLELLRGMREGKTVHGFRSAFKDFARESTGFSREVSEQALAHQISSEVEASYARGDLIKKRRQLMQAWESFCMKEFLNGTALFAVVPLKQKAA
jgi:integrase